MEEGRPSATAMIAAMLRIGHLLWDDASKIFQEPLALGFSGVAADQHAFLTCAYNHVAVGGTLAFETRNLHGKTYGTTSDYTLWRSFQDPTGRWIDVWVASRFDVQTMIDHLQLVRKVRATGETWPSQVAWRYIGMEELNRRLAAHGFTVVAQRLGENALRALQPGNYSRLSPGSAAWNRCARRAVHPILVIGRYVLSRDSVSLQRLMSVGISETYRIY